MKATNITKIPLLMVLLLTFVSCVTVNIYFPAAEIKKQAEEIVDEVYKENKKPGGGQDKTSSLQRFISWLGPRAAHAADFTSISNASIRGLKKKIAAHHGKLSKFYKNGKVGINNRGYLEIRDRGGMSLPDLRTLRSLVSADNKARKRLYQEVAKAKKLPGDQVPKIERIYARLWRDKARGGWWIQADNGKWRRK